MAAFDPDHALAILLQAKFNNEAKKQREKEKENVPVPIKKPPPRASLIDPEWEVTDPCPDIHGLFLAFNDRFFWGRLLGVEVKWSPQMTSCAGICVYEGRNGLCSVRLSAPLLKLRPRSDLVETLLHEMIHAYLFVTHNNRDRDGHGPEFHKHMHRINREAGTNITVYHSFHAEVKLYQQHWWRCDGPCQYRQPFFGMVKRAKNRAPSHNDPWWADHQAACGGQFIKIREPDNYANKKSKGTKVVTKPKEGKDIRNYFKKPEVKNGPASATTTNGSAGSNVFGFNNLRNGSSTSTSAAAKPVGGSPVNRVVGFGDLTAGTAKGRGNPVNPFGGGGNVLGVGASKKSPGRGVGRGGMLANRGGGTLVVTGPHAKNKPTDKPGSPNTKLRIDNFKVFVGNGHTLGGSSTVVDRSRSRLLSIGQEPEQKKQKMDNNYGEGSGRHKELKSDGEGSNRKEEDKDQMCKCSVCNKSMLREEITDHMEDCAGLQNVFSNSLVEDKADESEVNEINSKYKTTCCPVCSLDIEGDINAHLDDCLNSSEIKNIFDEPPIELSDGESPVQFTESYVPKPKGADNDSDVEIIESENRVPCPICRMRFGESRINNHVNQCLDDEDDD